MKLPYTKQEDYLIPNIMIDMCFVLLNRNSIICLFCQLEFIKVNMIYQYVQRMCALNYESGDSDGYRDLLFIF